MNVIEFRIGRNDHLGFPMSVVLWASYIQWAREYLQSLAIEADGDWVEVHEGDGEWNGVREDSAVVTLYRKQELSEPESVVEYAQFLARSYNQDAVGVVFGKSIITTRVGA